MAKILIIRVEDDEEADDLIEEIESGSVIHYAMYDGDNTFYDSLTLLGVHVIPPTPPHIRVIDPTNPKRQITIRQYVKGGLDW